MTNDELLEGLEQFLEDNDNSESRIRIAIIDHISSTPAILNPIHQIIPMLKARGILVVIDGAHAVGQVPIDLKALGPDFYVSNCHKWLYAARGSSVLFVDKAQQSTIHPAQISSSYSTPSRFQDEFFWTGTMDYSSYMTIPAALEFRRSIGEEVIRNYTHGLAREGGQLLAERFGTEVLQSEEQMGSMVDVALPIANPDDSTLSAQFWCDILLDRFNVYLTPYKHNGRWWARLSAQIYNDLTDFSAAAEVFSTICDEINGWDVAA
jgi:selenocysteine lyase/cysteine desulfurase